MGDGGRGRRARHGVEHRHPRLDGGVRAGDPPRGARSRQVHVPAGDAHRPRRRVGNAAHGRHRRGVPRARDHARRRVPDDRPRRPAARTRHGGRGRREAAPDARRLAGGRPGRVPGPVSTVAASAATPSIAPVAVAGASTPSDVTLASAPDLTSRPVLGTAPPVALYVHVPFCVAHCPYCDFVVVAGREARGPANRIGAFVSAVEAELALRADALDARWGAPGSAGGEPDGPGAPGARPVLSTLYLGGGTPSLLPAPTVAGLIELVRGRFGLEAGAEVTLEVNPGSDERGDAHALRGAGVTRLSIGAQSLDPAELRALGRRHSPADVAETVGEARVAGIVSVSLDLLYDVPGQSIDAWAGSLDDALALEPDHLSLYALTLDDPDEEGLTGPAGDHLPLRPGARRWRERARPGQDEDRAAAMYELADERLARAGFEWYEISNWARPGHRSRHNLAYWQGASWEAVGPGAHAFDGETRRWNAARLDAYLAALLPPDGAEPRLPPGGQERGTLAARAADAAILGLRTRDGLSANALEQPALAAPLRWALEAGLLERTAAERLVLTRAGRLLSNELLTRLV